MLFVADISEIGLHYVEINVFKQCIIINILISFRIVVDTGNTWMINCLPKKLSTLILQIGYCKVTQLVNVWRSRSKLKQIRH